MASYELPTDAAILGYVDPLLGRHEYRWKAGTVTPRDEFEEGALEVLVADGIAKRVKEAKD